MSRAVQKALGVSRDTVHRVSTLIPVTTIPEKENSGDKSEEEGRIRWN